MAIREEDSSYREAAVEIAVVQTFAAAAEIRAVGVIGLEWMECDCYYSKAERIDSDEQGCVCEVEREMAAAWREQIVDVAVGADAAGNGDGAAAESVADSYRINR